MNALLSPPSSESVLPPAPPPALTELGRLGDDRELVVLAGARGSLLVVDRRTPDGSDPRLIAHVTSDEPAVNATIVGELYLADQRRPTCRPLTAADLAPPPASDGVTVSPTQPDATCGPVLLDRHGIRFRLAVVPGGEHRGPELRWLREPPAGTPGAAQCVSARRVVGALEDYDPVRSLTGAAIERHRRDPSISVATLGLELRRLGASPIVLNRRLREAVVDASARRGLSLSAIALACGRAKLDRRGRHSGETSWLARRVGLLADEAGRRPNPWVHTDVLALIARDGLGIAPHEVELG
ncbi:MAG: hypothetical protein QOF77_597 [Solirubrobacteraceae bacterium]|nr:hypothetical protein [Solirubrobacteraceae bacterium]